jgi:hypothetical protein
MTLTQIIQEIALSRFGKYLSDVTIEGNLITITLETSVGDISNSMTFNSDIMESEDFATKSFIGQQVVNKLQRKILIEVI